MAATRGSMRSATTTRAALRSRTRLRCRAGTEQQWQRRAQGYEPKLSKAGEAPVWTDVSLRADGAGGPAVRREGSLLVVNLDVEVSRQKIAAKDAYAHIGQRATVRVGDEEVEVDVCSPPFDDELNWLPLYKLRGDIPTGATRTLHRDMRKKMTEEEEEDLARAKGGEVSVTGHLQLVFHGRDTDSGGARAKLINALSGANDGEVVDGVKLGPFAGNGIDLRRLMGTFMFRKLLFFAQASHIHLAKACIEDRTPHGLELAWREENRLYYIFDEGEGEDGDGSSPVPFEDEFARWKSHFNTEVRVARPVPGSSDDWSPEAVFDRDDLEYYPEETGCVIFGDDAFVSRMRELAAAAEIPERNVLDSLTSPRAPVKILRAEQIDAYCPPDRLSEVAAFESELKDTGKSIV